jgi:hypothetical protein
MTTNISQAVNDAGILEFIPQMFTILTTLVIQAIPLIFIVMLIAAMFLILGATVYWIVKMFKSHLGGSMGKM